MEHQFFMLKSHGLEVPISDAEAAKLLGEWTVRDLIDEWSDATSLIGYRAGHMAREACVYFPVSAFTILFKVKFR